MEPTIEPVEVGLLIRHASLPSNDAVLERFASYYRESLERALSIAAADESDAARAAGAAMETAASFEELAAEAALSGMMTVDSVEEPPAWDGAPVDEEPPAWGGGQVDDDLATSHDLPALADDDEAPPWANEPDEPEDPDDAPTRQAPFAAAPEDFFAESDEAAVPFVDEAAAAAAWATDEDENLIQGDFVEDGEGPAPVVIEEEATRAMAAMPDDDGEDATSMMQAMPEESEGATTMMQAMPEESDDATTMMQAMPDEVDAVSVEALPGDDSDSDGEPETQRSGRKTRKRSRKSKTMK
ncbi:MAG: hypothetical protein R3F39_22820 [Myxococcota bacterium]